MKLVKEYINEKFTEDSDPIHDMGIGLLNQIETYFEKNEDSNIKNYRRGGLIGVNAVICKLVADNKSIAWVNYLLQLPEVNIEECEKFWILEWACYRNNVEMIKLLIQYGADINHRNTENNHDCGTIVNAICTESVEALQYLIDNGANVYEDQLNIADKFAEKNKTIIKNILLKGLKNKINEKFVEDSDPIKDMGIGGYSFETLRPGTIIQPKRSMTYGRKSGRLVGYGRGLALYPIYYLLITSIHQYGNEKNIRFLFYKDIYSSQLNKEHFSRLTPAYLNIITNKGIIVIKKTSFNNRFKIIERGF